MGKKFNYDISIILPSMNEGESVRGFYDEVIQQLESMDLNWEIIALDTPSLNDSYDVAREFAEKYHNFTAISLAENRKAGNDKTLKYMIGFDLAKGRYIVQMDTDGQDNPADLPKFIEKLDKGFDLVVGYKQNRKDTTFYMFQSKIGNGVNRALTGVKVHDMNCGFKGYQSHVAKSLNLQGRWYRLIPALLQSRGFQITEVPIENRKRVYGKTNFSFTNRLQSGFDLIAIGILIRFGDTPIYFWGWLSVIMIGIGFLLFIPSFFISSLEWSVVFMIISMILLLSGIISFMFGMFGEFNRFSDRFTWDDRDVNLYFRKSTESLNNEDSKGNTD